MTCGTATIGGPTPEGRAWLQGRPAKKGNRVLVEVDLASIKKATKGHFILANNHRAATKSVQRVEDEQIAEALAKQVQEIQQRTRTSATTMVRAAVGSAETMKALRTAELEAAWEATSTLTLPNPTTLQHTCQDIERGKGQAWGDPANLPHLLTQHTSSTTPNNPNLAILRHHLDYHTHSAVQLKSNPANNPATHTLQHKEGKSQTQPNPAILRHRQHRYIDTRTKHTSNPAILRQKEIVAEHLGRLSMQLQRGVQSHYADWEAPTPPSGMMGIDRPVRPPPVSMEPTRDQWDDYLSYPAHQQRRHYLAADQHQRVIEMTERAATTYSITLHECAEAAKKITRQVLMVSTEDLEIVPIAIPTPFPANGMCRIYQHPDGSYKFFRPNTDQPPTSTPGYPLRPTPSPPSPDPPEDRSTLPLVWPESQGWQQPQGISSTAPPVWGANNQSWGKQMLVEQLWRQMLVTYEISQPIST